MNQFFKIIEAIMNHRHRINRKTPGIRELVAENHIRITDIITPLFIIEGNNRVEEISSMPAYNRYSLDKLYMELVELDDMGLHSVLLFTKVPDDKKTSDCKEALNPENLMSKSISFIRDKFPHFTIFTDVALDPYSPFGHDGLVLDGEILNDETVEVLVNMSLLHASMGCDFVAPSDMMDGRIGSIRKGLESNGFKKTGILSYSAKYASNLYGPFREALDSAPGFGDKKTYQMDYRNRKEAVDEVLTDISEGADIVMVKPAGMYLDIIREIKNCVNVPVAAYQVSGEYSMIIAAAERGWLDEGQAIIESLIAIKRAGADIIASYFGKRLYKLLNSDGLPL